jgi:hypothetical protein
MGAFRVWSLFRHRPCRAPDLQAGAPALKSGIAAVIIP